MFKVCISRSYGPEIGDVDEGVVEGSEYAGYAKDEFTWWGWLVSWWFDGGFEAAYHL